MNITLEWPDPKLSPNARGHWRVKAEASKKARKKAHDTVLKLGYGGNEWENTIGCIEFRIAFYPPDNRHRDDDNLIAMMKPYRDGIADALGINDRRFKTIAEIMPAEKGKKRVEISLCAL